MPRRENRDPPPLLEDGMHPLTLAQVRARCVDAFPGGHARTSIMADLESFVAWLRSKLFRGVLWINGSFLTKDLRPKDVDILFCPDPVFLQSATEEQNDLLDGMVDENAVPCAPMCSVYVWCDVDPDHPRYLLDGETYWKHQFGLSRKNTAKGIGVLRLDEESP